MKTKRLSIIGALLTGSLLMYGTANTENQSDELIDDRQTTQAFENGTVKVNFSLRHENANVGTLLKSKATTLRSQVSFLTADDQDLQFGIGLTDVSNFFGTKYNPGVTSLARPTYTLVADPQGTGLTNLFFKYAGVEYTLFTAGRQFITVGNGRFIGTRSFRQFPQSFDAFTVQNKGIKDLTATYSYIDHVNTTNASSINTEGRRKLRSHLIHLNWDGNYYYAAEGIFFLNKDKTTSTNSSLIMALTLKSSNNFSEVMGFDYDLTIAQQQAKYNNPVHYKSHYWAANANKTFEGFDVSVGYERLSGKINTTANQAFKMPYGDYHNFLGHAEAFAITPVQGVQDFNVGAKAKVPSSHLDVGVAYHNFRFAESISGSGKIGHEFDLIASIHLNKNLDLDASFAQFYSNTALVDKSRRVGVSLNANF